MTFSTLLSAAGFFKSVLYIVLAIVVLLIMVLIHELGHYTAGRILKFKIEEFSIGFGKAIFSRTNKRGEKISLRILPLGGFCAFAGENEEGDKKNPEAFNNQKPWKRIIVLFMGAFFNFLSAILFSFILLVSFGYDVQKIESFSTDSVNTDVLEVGDVIWAVEGEKVDFAFTGTTNELLDKYKSSQDSVTLTIKRGKEKLNVEVDYYEKVVGEGESATTQKVLGIASMKAYRYNFVEALARCVPLACGFAWLVLKSLWLLFTFRLPLSQLGGPITTVSVMASQTAAYFPIIFVYMPLIAANLAMFNLLPFPALDGAHIVFTTVEWIRKKPINKKVENGIHLGGLIVLFAFVIIVDIIHFFT